MPEKLRDKKILYGLLLFFFLVVIPLVSYALLKDKFKVKEFKDVVEVNYQSDFKEGAEPAGCSGGRPLCGSPARYLPALPGQLQPAASGCAQKPCRKGPRLVGGRTGVRHP